VEASTRNKVQLVLVLAMVIAGIRVAWIFYERHEAAKTTRKELTEQPAWVKVGYYYPYYAYDAAAHRADLAHEAGKLGPLEKLDISDVVLQSSAGGEHRIMAIFEKDGKKYATGVGEEKSGNFKFYCNEMLFFEDPHQLYKHWPADIWQAIDQHQVKQGMSEMQADFAIGIGLMEQGGDETDKTLDYPNGGKPLDISYHNGKAIVVKPGQ
jgi:hypothetical protein